MEKEYLYHLYQLVVLQIHVRQSLYQSLQSCRYMSGSLCTRAGSPADTCQVVFILELVVLLIHVRQSLYYRAGSPAGICQVIFILELVVLQIHVIYSLYQSQQSFRYMSGSLYTRASSPSDTCQGVSIKTLPYKNATKAKFTTIFK